MARITHATQNPGRKLDLDRAAAGAAGTSQNNKTGSRRDG